MHVNKHTEIHKGIKYTNAYIHRQLQKCMHECRHGRADYPIEMSIKNLDALIRTTTRKTHSTNAYNNTHSMYPYGFQKSRETWYSYGGRAARGMPYTS